MRSYDRKFYGQLQFAVLISGSHSVSSELDGICFHTWTSVLIITSQSRQVEKNGHILPTEQRYAPPTVPTWSPQGPKDASNLTQSCP